MWCPNCKNEYIEGVTTCVDCGCDLVDELPEEVDSSAPQIIGRVADEEIGNKFIRFFHFSGVSTAGLLPRSEEDGFELAVSYQQLERAVELIQGLTKTESEDEIDLEKAAAVLDDQLEGIQEEEANELLSDLRREASTVYVNKKDTYSDLKFSGYSFIVFAILGYAFAGLNLAGVIALFNNFSMLVLAVVFTIFLFIGISSLRKAKRIHGLVSEEENLLGQVEDYIETEFTDDYIASLNNAELPEEENFFHVTEILKAKVIERFPLFSKGYIDQLVDGAYGAYCDRQTTSQPLEKSEDEVQVEVPEEQ